MTGFALRCLAAVGLVASMTATHAGMMNAPCDRPVVFRDAAVNVVVLPFALPTQNSRAANRLAQLVQRETLRSVAKFGSVASVQLGESDDRACVPAEVRAKLLGEQPTSGDRLAPGRAVVLVWGRIVESGDQLYSQVYVDFVRGRSTEKLELPFGTDRLVGPLGAQGFAGPQRSMDRATLARIDDFARRSNVLYESPDENADRVTIPPDVPFSYYVTEIRGDWMRIVVFPGSVPPGSVNSEQNAFGKKQWIRAVAAEPEWTLRKVWPEIAFVEGVTGYLVTSDPKAAGTAAARATMAAAASRALDEFQENLHSNGLAREQESFDERYAGARAVALELQGALQLLGIDRGDAALRAARARFAESSRLRPGNAEARNLTLMTDLVLARQADSPEPALKAADALLATLGIAPSNVAVQANLRVAYRWLLGLAGPRPPAWRVLTADERSHLADMLSGLNQVAPYRGG
jgi:hypothetical protein